MNLVHAVVAFGAAFLAGAINSVAGGGTLISFPALIWLGIPPVTANATNTAAIWVGSAGGMWGYRREMRTASRRILALVAPSLAGGIAGALMLRWTPPAIFERLVPFLILFATLLFMAQEPVQRVLNTAGAEAHNSARWLAGAMLFQLLVAVYGGYFGAGIGILMLASLGFIGLSNIHEMNTLKTILSSLINVVAAVWFICAGLIHWPKAAVMTAGALLGYFLGSHYAQRISQQRVRQIVAAIGFVISAATFYKQFVR